MTPGRLKFVAAERTDQCAPPRLGNRNANAPPPGRPAIRFLLYIRGLKSLACPGLCYSPTLDQFPFNQGHCIRVWHARRISRPGRGRQRYKGHDVAASRSLVSSILHHINNQPVLRSMHFSPPSFLPSLAPQKYERASKGLFHILVSLRQPDYLFCPVRTTTTTTNWKPCPTRRPHLLPSPAADHTG